MRRFLRESEGIFFLGYVQGEGQTQATLFPVSWGMFQMPLERHRARRYSFHASIDRPAKSYCLRTRTMGENEIYRPRRLEVSTMRLVRKPRSWGIRIFAQLDLVGDRMKNRHTISVILIGFFIP